MNIPHYISELLFRYDCVVVPGFGAFVSTYAPARIQVTQHTFHPPSKQLVFNKHLQQNDGLLAQTIVDESKCSFDEAMKAIGTFISETTEKLKAGKKVELHNVGVLSMDKAGTIAFDAAADVNYLIDSFGLGSFQSLPVIRENAIEKKKPVVREDKVLPDEKTAPERILVERPRRARRVLITSAVIIPLLVGGLWFTSKQTNALAGFWFFKSNAPSEYHLPKKLSIDLHVPAVEELKPDASGIAKISMMQNAPDIVVNIHKVVPDSTMVAQAQVADLHIHAKSNWSGSKYYVIAGAFAVPDNVEKFRRMLESKGFNAQVVERLSSRLTHVGIASFGTKEEAEQFISRIGSDVPGAWILRK